MRFKYGWSTGNTRYRMGTILAFSGLISLLVSLLIASDAENYFKTVVSLFDKNYFSFFLKLFAIIFAAGQILGYLITQKYPKYIEIGQKLIVVLFNNTVMEFDFDELESIMWSQDAFKNLILVKKNGEKVLIKKSIQTPEKAFDLIAEKIEEANQKNKI